MGRGQSKNKISSDSNQQKRIQNDILSFAEIENKTKEILENDLVFKNKQIELVSLSGSYAYGIARPDSDLDLRGVYMASADETLGLINSQEHLENHSQNNDIIIYELGRFFKLALRSNPNIIEMLFSPTIVQGKIGEKIKEATPLFVTQELRRTYSGFVASQIKKNNKMIRSENYKEKQISKNLFHAYRLLDNCHDLLLTGKMNPTITNLEEIKRKISESENKIIINELTEKLDFIDHLKTDLPLAPNLKKINQLFLGLRKDQIKTDYKYESESI